MREHSFDDLTRRFASARTRRQVLGLFGRGALGALAGGASGVWFSAAPALAACIVEYPPADLDDCPNKRPHPGNTRGSNGCGPANSDFRPPQSFGSAPFTVPCNNHDICYETCNTPKSTCDVTFGDQLVDVCIATYGGSFLMETACILVAGVYELAVTVGGGSAYEAGQTKDCECCRPVPQVWCGCNQKCYTSAADCTAECHGGLGCFGQTLCGPATPEQCP